MTVRTEVALAGVFAAVQAACVDAGYPAPARNRSIPVELPRYPSGDIDGAPGLFIGFADGPTDVDAEMLGPGGYDLTQRPVVEVIVEDPDPARLFVTFAAAIDVIATALEGIDLVTLGDTVSRLAIDRIEREDLITDDMPATRAAALVLAITLWSERPL